VKYAELVLRFDYNYADEMVDENSIEYITFQEILKGQVCGKFSLFKK